MTLLESIHELPKIEKIKVMEFLWEELTLEEDKYSSPQWHKNALIETEKRLAEGKEKIIDWNEAKQLLRNEFK
jgi:hypothetical protein